ncbi:MAG: hypothetical protein D6775_07360 [Caldilineae bacterium]|nr:MAG: hypothetical protein D6775_07360 [Caldilineae bacterium]
MSTEGTAPQSEQQQSTQETTSSKAVLEELTVLGRKLGKAVQTVLESPQRYEIEEEVREGFQTIVKEVDEALAKARSTEVAKDVGEQAERVYETVKSSKVTHELREGLLKGLQTLNKELDELVSRLEAQKPAEETAPPAETEAASEPETSDAE